MKKLLYGILVWSSLGLLLVSCEDKYLRGAEKAAYETAVEYYAKIRAHDYYTEVADKSVKLVPKMVEDFEEEMERNNDGILPYSMAVEITMVFQQELGLKPRSKVTDWQDTIEQNFAHFAERYAEQFTGLYYTMGRPHLYSEMDTSPDATVRKLLTDIKKPVLIKTAVLDTMACSIISDIYYSVMHDIRVTGVDSYSGFRLPEAKYPVPKKNVRKYYTVYMLLNESKTLVCNVTLDKNGKYYTDDIKTI